jgi:hypothetical protein
LSSVPLSGSSFGKTRVPPYCGFSTNLPNESLTISAPGVGAVVVVVGVVGAAGVVTVVVGVGVFVVVMGASALHEANKTVIRAKPVIKIRMIFCFFIF